MHLLTLSKDKLSNFNYDKVSNLEAFIVKLLTEMTEEARRRLVGKRRACHLSVRDAFGQKAYPTVRVPWRMEHPQGRTAITLLRFPQMFIPPVKSRC